MTDGQRNYEEKRDFIRMTIDSRVELSVGASRYEGVCVDLSSSGMQVRALNTSLAVGDKLQASLASSHPLIPPLNVEGTVVRVDNVGNGQQMLGLETKKLG